MRILKEREGREKEEKRGKKDESILILQFGNSLQGPKGEYWVQRRLLRQVSY